LEAENMAKSNGDLVEKACRLAHDLGREVATPAEARAHLGLETTPRPAR
jgi:3-keto-5-aminohexanoate cleavage enzyme